MRSRAEAAAALLKALANRSRLLLLCELLDGERTVGDLSDAVGMSMSAVSQHLARLREESLVSTRRESQTVHYALADAAAERMLRALHDHYRRAATARKPPKGKTR
ncbi:MAG: helix-turn-helix domain-containing protein [Hyphomicrobiales bacterium]|nr:helix-turn-helix domain-containing protein [Hyphomicrobiales bacterium]